MIVVAAVGSVPMRHCTLSCIFVLTLVLDVVIQMDSLEVDSRSSGGRHRSSLRGGACHVILFKDAVGVVA